jgi:predicted dehydrogenase
LPTVRTTIDIADVLADDEVRGVAIATPPGTHGHLAAACIEAGKDVLVEKPLASSLDEGIEMVRIADNHDRIIMCDHTFCYTGAVRTIRDLVRGGELGEVQYVDSVRINLGLVQSDVDVFWDLAPHDLSILDFILPDDVLPVSVAAHGSDPLRVGHSCVGYLTVQLSNGSIAHANLNWLSPSKIRTTIIGGSKKMLVWNDLLPTQPVSIFDSAINVTEELGEAERRRMLVSYRAGDMLAPAIKGVEALRLVVEEFAEAIRERRRPLTDGHAGLRVLEILTAVQQSLDNDGAVVPLGLQD